MGDIAFTSNSVAYELTFALLPWIERSGLITGTVNIATTALSTQQVSDGVVRGLIGREGVVVAFRSTDPPPIPALRAGLSRRRLKQADTSFSEHFSSTAGGEVLEATANNTTSKFARTFSNALILADGSSATSGVYRIGCERG